MSQEELEINPKPGPWCCVIGCHQEAVFDLEDETHRYLPTQSCLEHVGHLCFENATRVTPVSRNP